MSTRIAVWDSVGPYENVVPVVPVPATGTDAVIRSMKDANGHWAFVVMNAPVHQKIGGSLAERFAHGDDLVILPAVVPVVYRIVGRDECGDYDCERVV